MSTKTEEEFVKKIEYSRNRIKKYENMWNQIIPDQIPSTYHSMGLNARHIAIYSLLLGNKDEARRWFEKAAEYYLKRIETGSKTQSVYQGNDPGVYLDAFYTSVLSGDTNLPPKIAEGILGMDTNFPQKFPDVAKTYWYSKSLAGLILDKPSIVSENLKALVNNNKIQKNEFFKGASEFIEGLLKKDIHLVSKGISNIIETHEKRIKSGQPLADDELVSISGTAMFLMAREKGLKIKPDDVKEKYREYIPWVLLD